MTDLTLRAATRAQLTLSDVGDQLLVRMQRAAERLRREQTGQDVIEYAGMVVLVAAIIVAIIQIGIPGKVGTAVSKAVTSIFGGGGGSGSTSTGGG
jgi:Flp pilus assembly pilin Flp